MSTQVVVQPMLWASTKDIAEVDPVTDKDADVLRDLHEVLMKHNAVDRFGIMLIHKHFDLAENEQMVEFTDVENRRLTLQPMLEGTVANTIQTSWKFPSDPDAPREAMADCVWRCFYNPNSTPQHVGKHSVG